MPCPRRPDSVKSDFATEAGLSEIIPIAGQHRPIRGRLHGVVAAAAGVINVAAVVFLSSGIEAFHMGARNVDPPFMLGRDGTLALAMWAISGLALVVLAFSRAIGARWLARGALIVCVAAVPVGCYSRPLPDDCYDQGFRSWAALHVPADSIRQWNATLTPVAKPFALPASQWPPDVRRLSPASVTQLSGGQGVVLQWGVRGTWGTARAVVICASSTIAPPRDDDFLWKQVRDCLYAAFENGG